MEKCIHLHTNTFFSFVHLTAIMCYCYVVLTISGHSLWGHSHSWPWGIRYNTLCWEIMACLLCRVPLQDVVLNSFEGHNTFCAPQSIFKVDCQCFARFCKPFSGPPYFWWWQEASQSKAFSQSLSDKSSMHVLTLKDTSSTRLGLAVFAQRGGYAAKMEIKPPCSSKCPCIS